MIIKAIYRVSVFALLLVTVLGCSSADKMGKAPEMSDAWMDLFDGTSTEGWEMTGPGSFTLNDDGTITSEGGMGLFYYKDQMFKDFELELEWMSTNEKANSGVFVRFPDAPDPWYAVNTGYEIQIDDSQNPINQTGSIYSFSAPFHLASKPLGEWNTYKIKVTGQRYQIYLNGEQVNDFYGDRSLEGMIGLQNHDDESRVSFRNIRVKSLGDTGAAQSLAEHFAVEEARDPINVLMLATTHGFRHGPAIDMSKEVMEALSATTEFNVDVTEDVSVLTKDNLANYDLLFFANSTLRLKSEGSSEAEAALMGDHGTWDLSVDTPQGEVKGRLAISNADDGHSGQAQFSLFPGTYNLSDLVVEDDKLGFSWEVDGMGKLVADVMLDGDELKGTIVGGGAEVPVVGTKVMAQDAGIAGNWTVESQAPDGTMTLYIALADADGLEGSITNDPSQGAAPLMDLKRDGDALTFYFDTPDFGRIDGKADVNGNDIKGTFSVSGFDVPFSGGRDGTVEKKGAEELVTQAQQDAIMDFLAQGKGVVGAHSALDAFYDWEDYKNMVGGGLFVSHPWTQSVRILVEEKDNPAVSHYGDSFTIRDEIYVLDENPRWNSKVLLSLDMDSVEPEADARGAYRNDYPISWLREHNGGRVFYTKLGHFPDVWTTPSFVEHLLQGMRMAANRIESDFSGHMVKETISDNVWPDDLAVDDEGNVWIAELNGKVHRYDNETGETKLIAELPTTDPKNIEHGLYGIEVDPNFYGGDPYVYVFYAEQESIINQLTRIKYENGMLNMDTEEVLLRVPTEPQCCHQAGDIEWGPDGALYLSTGDTGMSETRPEWEISDEEMDEFKSSNNLEQVQWSRLVDSERTSQNLQDLRGKILRINKDGSIPKDNPFYGEAGARWEVYAYGLRNPYRFKIDPDNGNLFIGVVGPDAQFDYDEYNISSEGGENFGWPREIGLLAYNEWTPDMIPNYSPPVWEYTYETGGRSASGGPIYKHKGPGGFPPIFQDRVFVYDWARSWIKYGKLVEEEIEITKTNGETYTMKSPRLVDVKEFDTLRGTRPISMDIGPDGSIYVAEFTGFWYAAPGSKVTRYRWVSNDK
ncbi:MAG: family 16 glycoside hydrolase [Bacteroidota bacterium]